MTDSTDNDRKCMFKDAVKNLECCAELVIKELVGKIYVNDINLNINFNMFMILHTLTPTYVNILHTGSFVQIFLKVTAVTNGYRWIIC